MITEAQVVNGIVKEGTRVVYTKKDGTQIRGVVRHVYLDQKKLSMKPDEPIKGEKDYPQTFRFRRLSIDNDEVEFFGIQLAPLVLMNEKIHVPDELKRVFSCSDGLMATDGRRVFVEKVNGLQDGFVKNNLGGTFIAEYSQAALRRETFTSSIIEPKKNLIPVKNYYKMSLGEQIASIMVVNQREFNKTIRKLKYTKGYWAKRTDYITIEFKDKKVLIQLYNKNDDKFDSLLITENENGVGTINGEVSTIFLLFDLRELIKGIRKKEFEIEFFDSGSIKIETLEQKRIQFYMETSEVEAVPKHRKGRIAARKK